jgi:lipopolysaccharide export system permease protein
MLFDSTVRKELARAFGATLVVILTIVLTQMLIQTLGKAADGMVAPQDVVLLLGFGAIKTLPTVLALSLFVAVVVTLGRMYRDSEMAIWFASGIGLARFVRPVLHMAWPVLTLVGLLGLVIWPWSNQKIEEMRQEYEQRSDLSRVAPGSFQTSRDGSRVFFVEREADNDASGTRRSVFMLGRSGEREAVTTARTGHIDTIAKERQLVLDGGHRNEHDLASGDSTHTQFDSFRMTLDQARAAAVATTSPKVLPMSALVKAPTPENLGELTWRLGLLFGATNLILLGIGTSATNPRRASNWNLMFALLAFVIYYNLLNLSQAWVGSGRSSMAGALLLLHGGAFALATALIWWRDHATVLVLWPRRAAKAGA